MDLFLKSADGGLRLFTELLYDVRARGSLLFVGFRFGTLAASLLKLAATLEVFVVVTFSILVRVALVAGAELPSRVVEPLVDRVSKSLQSFDRFLAGTASAQLLDLFQEAPFGVEKSALNGGRLFLVNFPTPLFETSAHLVAATLLVFPPLVRLTLAVPLAPFVQFAFSPHPLVTLSYFALTHFGVAASMFLTLVRFGGMLVQLSLQTFDLPADLSGLGMPFSQLTGHFVQLVAELADPSAKIVMTTMSVFQFLTLSPLGPHTALVLSLQRRLTISLAPLGSLLSAVDSFHGQPDGPAPSVFRMRQQPGASRALLDEYERIFGGGDGESVGRPQSRPLPVGNRTRDDKCDGQNGRERVWTAHDRLQG